MPSFPGNIRVFTPRVDLEDVVKAKHMNDVQAEITAIQVEIGTDPSGGSNTVRERIEDVETGLAAIPTGADPYPQYYNTPRHEDNNHSFVQHNQLSGLTSGDPHPQYYNQSRGDARYAKIGDIPDTSDFITGEDVPPPPETPFIYAYRTWPGEVEHNSTNPRRLTGPISVPRSWGRMRINVRATWVMNYNNSNRSWLEGHVCRNISTVSPFSGTSPSATTHLFPGGRGIMTGSSAYTWRVNPIPSGSGPYISNYGVILNWINPVNWCRTKHVYLEAFAFPY